MTFAYLYSKFFKRIIRGTSILNSEIDKTAKVYSGSTFYNSKIGRHSYVGYDSEVISCDIGAFCSIASGLVVGGAKHPLGWVSTSPAFYNTESGNRSHLGNLSIDRTARTTIGNDVWIGSRATIMQGVTIGNGAVIGAGAIVTKDVDPYAIVAGCPAKIIRYRFDKEVIVQLQKTEWWLKSDDELRNLVKYMNEPKLFIKEFNAFFNKNSTQ